MHSAKNSFKCNFTEQLAEIDVSLLSFSFPFSGEGHCGVVAGGGVRVEMLREERGAETKTLPCLYTRHLDTTPSSACDDTRVQSLPKMMTTVGEEAITCTKGRLWSSTAVANADCSPGLSSELTCRSTNSLCNGSWSHPLLLLLWILTSNKCLCFKIRLIYLKSFLISAMVLVRSKNIKSVQGRQSASKT